MTEHGLPHPGAWLSASLAADARAAAELPPAAICDLVRVAGAGCATGPAIVVDAEPGQHVRPLLDHDGLDGAVLVVGGLREARGAILGGAMAEQLAERGLRAIVTDGRVRDRRELEAAGLSVWCAGGAPFPGVAPVAGAASATTVEGVRIATGDVVVADDDGIVVWPAERAPELLRRAFERHVRDQERRARRLGELREQLGGAAA